MRMDSTTLPLHERLLLLVLDGQKGTSRSQHAATGLAGAVLLDLVRLGSVAITDQRVTASSGVVAPPGVLTEATALIAGEPKSRTPRWWVDHLPGRMKPFLPRLSGRLVECGVLTLEHHKVLGVFSTTRMPERDRAPEEELHDRLRAVLVGERDPDEADSILAGLVAALDLIGTVVAKDQRKDAARRAKELAKGNELGDTVGQAIKAAQDAVMVAIIASTVASSAAATSAAT